ncbi:Mobile element protein [hydrothermal vent metagenome]|uniref:Mobile element protein n=1 Tax=hydrothermal vent metagenome TaxID=652676 RepID=A0A3B0WTP9_9ZZZZ
MKLYCGIDLHSNNSVVVILDEKDKVIYQKKLDNNLALILQQLSIYKSKISAIAIESTFNWYWLVDGLIEAGYTVKLVNTAAVQTYSGLKHTDDKDDARWLAHLMRLKILPTGFIYPKEERAVRDLLRKRSQLVRQSTTNILSLQNILARNTAQSLSSYKIKKLDDEQAEKLINDPNITLSLKSNLNIIRCLQSSINEIETAVLKQTRIRKEFKKLLTVAGIGKILGLTIMLESGDMNRFAKVGNFSSYCRCVKSERFSNGKKKGEGNRKNGNKYLAWAFIEAANFAVRYNGKIKSFYQKKKAKTNGIIAIKAVANKLARACYHILKDQVAFDVNKAFA